VIIGKKRPSNYDQSFELEDFFLQIWYILSEPLVANTCSHTEHHIMNIINTWCLTMQEFRVLLTGTPLQNNVEELFSLLNFLEPAKFPILSAFMEKFGDLKTEEQVEQLKEVRWNVLCICTLL